MARKSFQNLRVRSGILIDEMKNILVWKDLVQFDEFFLEFLHESYVVFITNYAQFLSIMSIKGIEIIDQI